MVEGILKKGTTVAFSSGDYTGKAVIKSSDNAGLDEELNFVVYVADILETDDGKTIPPHLRLENGSLLLAHYQVEVIS